ncbi:MAG: sulfatase [Bryobacteraceae bacterium]
MRRREFLASALAAGTAAAQKRKPNIVIVFADDLGYGDLACYGSRVNRTPRLDGMAREGVRFTDCYVPMPFCAPSRASLLTGRYPFRHGVVYNPSPDSGTNSVRLPASEITLAEQLKPLGYRSICIGKWHLGHRPEALPRTQGFDQYYGVLYSNDMRPVQLVHNERVSQYPVPQAQLTRDYTERALRFMEQNRSNPFLLYLPHAMPHKPLAASEDFYRPGTSKELYAAVLRELDWSVGQILDRIKALGLEDNTLVVFTSDNGAWYGGSTGGLRGMKGRPWEGGIRVPMIARWPGRIPAGRVSKEVCGVIDLFPTASGLAGAPLPEDRVIDGRNIFPLMTGAGARSPHTALFAMSGPKLAMVRSGKWKLLVGSPGSGDMLAVDRTKRWVDPRGPDGVTIIAPYEQAQPSEHPGVTTGDTPADLMLFDLEADPSEQHNLADREPATVARLKGHFDKLNAEVPVFPVPERAAGGMLRLKGGSLDYDRVPKD